MMLPQAAPLLPATGRLVALPVIAPCSPSAWTPSSVWRWCTAASSYDLRRHLTSATEWQLPAVQRSAARLSGTLPLASGVLRGLQLSARVPLPTVGTRGDWRA